MFLTLQSQEIAHGQVLFRILLLIYGTLLKMVIIKNGEKLVTACIYFILDVNGQQQKQKISFMICIIIWILNEVIL